MSDRPLATARYGAAGAGHTFQSVVATPLSFVAALEVIRSVLAERDLWIIHEIDPQMLLARAGYSIARTRQILFFHPRYMVRLLSADPAALPEAPLKIVVVEENERVSVRWLVPEALLERYGNTELMDLAHELASTYAAIADRLEAHSSTLSCSS
jgi:uncharacterized protein (DUF302 family)